MSQQTTSHRNSCRGFVAIAAAAIAVLGSGIAQAAVKSWDADTATAGLQAGDGAWDSGTQWSSGGANVAWTDGDDASFTASGTDNVTIGGTVQANLLNIAGPTVNISGGTLQLGPGGISSTNGSGGPLTINSALSLNGSQTWATRWSSPTKIIVNGSIGEGVVGSKLTIGLLPSSTGGVVTLNGNNSYTGGTELAGGSVSALTLQIGSDTAVGSGTLTLSGGTLASSVAVTLANAVSVTASTTTTLDNGLANLTLNGNISGIGALTIKNAGGNGHLYLGGDNSGFAGVYTNSQRNVYFKAANAGSRDAGYVISNGSAIMDFGGGTIHLGSLSSAITYAKVTTAASTGNYTIVVGERNQDSTYASEITQSSGTVLSLTKAGSAKLSLTSANSAYTGPTTITGGILSATTLANINTSSSIGRGVSTNNTTNAASLVLDGGTLQYSGAGNSTDRLFTLGSGGGALDASGSAAVNFTKAAPIAFSGTGIRTLTLTGANTGDNTLVPVIGNSGSDATSLVKSGVGTWKLSGTNTYTGATTIEAGILKLATASGSNIASSQRIDIAAGATLDVTGVTGNGGAFLLSAGQVIAGDGAILGNVALGSGTLEATLGETIAFAGLDLSSASDTLTITNPGFTSGTYVIATYTGSLNGTFDAFPAGYQVTYDTANSQILVTVPEPGVLALGAMVSLAALSRRRNRRVAR